MLKSLYAETFAIMKGFRFTLDFCEYRSFFFIVYKYDASIGVCSVFYIFIRRLGGIYVIWVLFFGLVIFYFVLFGFRWGDKCGRRRDGEE